MAQAQRSWRQKLVDAEAKEQRKAEALREMEAAVEERQACEAKKYNEVIRSLNEDLEARDETHRDQSAKLKASYKEELENKQNQYRLELQALKETNMNLEGDLGKRNSELCAAKDREIDLNKTLESVETKAQRLVRTRLTIV